MADNAYEQNADDDNAEDVEGYGAAADHADDEEKASWKVPSVDNSREPSPQRSPPQKDALAGASTSANNHNSADPLPTGLPPTGGSKNGKNPEMTPLPLKASQSPKKERSPGQSMNTSWDSSYSIKGFGSTQSKLRELGTSRVSKDHFSYNHNKGNSSLRKLAIYQPKSTAQDFTLPYKTPLSSKIYIQHPRVVDPTRLKTILPGLYIEPPSIHGVEGRIARPRRSTPLSCTDPAPATPTKGTQVPGDSRRPTVELDQVKDLRLFTTYQDARHTPRWCSTIHNSYVAEKEAEQADSNAEHAIIAAKIERDRIYFSVRKSLGVHSYKDEKFQLSIGEINAWHRSQKQRDEHFQELWKYRPPEMEEEEEQAPQQEESMEPVLPPRPDSAPRANAHKSHRGGRFFTAPNSAYFDKYHSLQAGDIATRHKPPDGFDKVGGDPSLWGFEGPSLAELNRKQLDAEVPQSSLAAEDNEPSKPLAASPPADISELNPSQIPPKTRGSTGGSSGVGSSRCASAPIRSASLDMMVSSWNDRDDVNSPFLSPKFHEELTGEPSDDFRENMFPGCHVWKTDQRHQKWLSKVAGRKNINIMHLKLKNTYKDFQATIDIINRRQFMAAYTGGKLAKHIIAPDEHNYRAKQKAFSKMGKSPSNISTIREL